jgi:hypothetical protein
LRSAVNRNEVAVTGWSPPGKIAMTSQAERTGLRRSVSLAPWVAALGLVGLLAATSNSDAGSAVVGGMRLSCHPAEVVMSNEVPGPGFAVPGLLMFGPRFLKAYPPLVQRLVFLHECGHQYVGTDENAADCYAVEAGKRQGWLTQAGLAQACKALWHTLGNGAHLAGPERCAALQACYDLAPGPHGPH